MREKNNAVLVIFTSLCLGILFVIFYARYFRGDEELQKEEKPSEEVSTVLNFLKDKGQQIGEGIAEKAEDVADFDPTKRYKDSKTESIEDRLADVEERALEAERKAQEEEERLRQEELERIRQFREEKQREALRNRRELQKTKKELTNRELLIGNSFPYQIIVKPGWKILESQKTTVLSWKDEVTVTIETGPWSTNQSEFGIKTLEDIFEYYPRMQVVESSAVQMGYKTWIRSVLQESEEESDTIRQLMILSHGSRQGSYRVIIGGFAKALDDHVRDINTLLKSFRFPPDNFKPENANEVRIYIDGVRQFF